MSKKIIMIDDPSNETFVREHIAEDFPGSDLQVDFFVHEDYDTAIEKLSGGDYGLLILEPYEMRFPVDPRNARRAVEAARFGRIPVCMFTTFFTTGQLEEHYGFKSGRDYAYLLCKPADMECITWVVSDVFGIQSSSPFRIPELKHPNYKF